MKVKIIDQDVYGDGVAKEDGIPIFVEQALPNEEVDITITHDKPHFKRAKIESIITASIDRVNPLCTYYNVCGGCNLLHQAYNAQLIYKKDKVLNNLKRIAGISDINIDEIISFDQYNYRNKVTLHIKNNKLGFYTKNTNECINIDKCLLVNEKLNNVINYLNTLDFYNVKEITLRVSEFSNEILMLLVYDNDINETINEIIGSKLVNTIVISKDNKYKVVYGNGFITEKIGDYKFSISAQSFFQVNTKIATKLYETISSYLDKNKTSTVLDLYCGTGSIGISIANKVKKVIGIEEVEKAVSDANANKEINNITNIEFILGTVENNIEDIKKADVVIMDPPRSGSDIKTLDTIIKLSPKKIIYVSCDSATLARDLKHIGEFYKINDIKLFDMFPNTYHVETIVELIKI